MPDQGGAFGWDVAIVRGGSPQNGSASIIPR
jgi:hypothetical protein